MTILVEWDGESFVPRPAFRKRCDEDFVVHEIYRMDIREDRSIRSHQHYFASIREAWVNLPEKMAEQIPTPEHLRKWALIKAGYRDQRSIVAGSPDDAQRLVALVQSFDDFAIVTSSESVVTVYTAKSQSMRAMDKQEFARSKQAVLGIISTLAGVDQDELEAEAAANRYGDAA